MSGKIICETERLILREFIPEDAIEHFKLNEDPEVVRYTGNAPFSDLASAQTFMANYPDYRLHGCGRWACIDKHHGAFVGWCGIKYLPEADEYDLGYRFHRKYWGIGYATESARASVRLAFEKFGVKTLIGRAATANVASVNVLKKMGMQFMRFEDLDDYPGEIYALTKEQWECL